MDPNAPSIQPDAAANVPDMILRGGLHRETQQHFDGRTLILTPRKSQQIFRRSVRPVGMGATETVTETATITETLTITETVVVTETVTVDIGQTQTETVTVTETIDIGTTETVTETVTITVEVTVTVTEPPP